MAPKNALSRKAAIPERVREIFESPNANSGRLSKLYPHQTSALEAGIFNGKSLLLCTGTGSGKTAIAELASIDAIVSRGKKVVYITPLRALSGEKHAEFREKYGKFFRVSLSIGGLDENDFRLGESDIVFLTTEKLDALIRHKAEWVSEIGLLVADEIHEIGGGGRGPTLEIVIVKVKALCPDAQILALSATVGNARELADWLGSELVESDFRPVPLKEGTIHGRTIEFFGEKKERKAKAPGATGAVLDCLEGKSQAIIFNTTRRSAEKSAEELTETADKFVLPAEKEELKSLSKRVLDALPSPTAQCEKLAGFVLKGSAFHHAGLVHDQKIAIEEAFRKGLIKALSATVTLVAGMNLPARRIVLKGLTTWGSDGPRDWPVSLYKQAVGRAGRPGLDTLGESIVVAKDKATAEEIVEKYILGRPEDVSSLLGSPPVLRREILGIVSSGFASDLRGLLAFFEKTFYSHRNGGVGKIRETIENALVELSEWGFVEYFSSGERRGIGGFLELSKIVRGDETESKKSGKISLTKLGRRVSELYIDPLSAREITKGLESGLETNFSRLVLISSATEMMPGPTVRVSEEEAIWERISREKLKNVPKPWEPEAEVFARSVKLAIVLEAWANEVPDREIMEKMGIAPGDLRTRLVNSDWICYSACEIAKIVGKGDEASSLSKLRFRLEHGIKEELLELVRLPGIGRAKARRLYSSGLLNASAVLNSSKEKLAPIVGEKTAEKLLARKKPSGFF